MTGQPVTYTGRSINRFEDARFIRGEGAYVDDLSLPGMLHAAMLRSTYAHARIRSVDAAAARELPGVAAVLTGVDIEGVIADIAPIRREGMGETPVPEHPVLARDRVCYVGQPIAMVVAEDLATAYDALGLIAVDYEPLPPITDPREAARDMHEPLHVHIGTNVVMKASAGAGDVDGAFAAADRVVRGRFEVPRLVASPMECRGLLATYDVDGDALTLWTSTQVAHRVKMFLGTLLRDAPKEIRVVTPDVGGGFGRKIEVWPEELAACFLSIKLGRPVKWSETRSENMLASHGRGYTADVEAAVRNDGVILGMRFRLLADMGAYFLTSSGGPLGNAVQRVAGPYAIENMDVECLGVVTNKPPTGPYRGAGGPEAAVLIERMVDMVAAELAMDPVALRKRNFIPASAFPYETATGLIYDSGDFGAAFDRALELGEYDAQRAKQRDANKDGPLIGIGVATVVKASGGKAGVRVSNSRVRIDSAGLVHVYTDVSPHGQGTATSFAQIAADALGIPPERVRVYHGDTDELEAGNGTTSSRGLAVGGSAAYMALQEAREKVTRIGAHLLGCAQDQITLGGGTARHAASGKSVTMAEIAAAAEDANTLPVGLEPGLTFEVTWTLPSNPFAFAAHIALVEVDPGTGDIRLVRYAAVHDCGLMINPRIVRGQIQGGITQGIGQALSEAVFHDGDGQPLAGSFMTYGLPHTESTPDFVLEHLQTPSPTNPLGIKGIGELPTVASPVAVANAVVDALSGYGVRHLDMPISPEAVWHAMNPQA